MKVKIWDSERKTFIAYVEIPHIHAIALNESMENIINGNNNFFLSVCTRLRDNFKKIIYQDDIVSVHSDIWGTWRSTVFANTYSGKFYIESHPRDTQMMELNAENIEKFRIRKIGNVFENPELLENNKFVLN